MRDLLYIITSSCMASRQIVFKCSIILLLPQKNSFGSIIRFGLGLLLGQAYWDIIWFYQNGPTTQFDANSRPMVQIGLVSNHSLDLILYKKNNPIELHQWLVGFKTRSKSTLIDKQIKLITFFNLIPYM